MSGGSSPEYGSDTQDLPRLPRAGIEGGSSDRVVVVGLVSDPGVPSRVADALLERLPEDLSRHVSPDVSWEVRVLHEALALDDQDHVPLLVSSERVLDEQGWDLMICLTELPRGVGDRPMLYEVSRRHGAALVSLPALGAVRIQPRTRETIVELVDQLAERLLEQPSTRSVPSRRPGRMVPRLSPVRPKPGSDDEAASFFVLTPFRGRLRLLLGMVRNNRPWRLVPSLSSAIAAAAAAAAFGIFYSSIWAMADAASGLRLSLVSFFAVVLMVVWLIVHNRMWELPAGQRPGERAVLYNTSTALTLLIGVGCMYVLLFVIALLGALAVIPPDYLQVTLSHPVGLGDYAQIAWLASSMGTVAGALGSSLESEDAVRRATYSRREQERRARREQDERINMGPSALDGVDER